MVIWIIGMSGSGKTTVARHLHSYLQATGAPWLLLDGNDLRAVLGERDTYRYEDREAFGERVSRLSLEFDRQGINVLASILSIFPSHQEWNRANMPTYREVYLRVPFEELVRRDNKNLYQAALAGEIANVVGVDIPFVAPKKPDLVIDNEQDLPDLWPVVETIIDGLGLAPPLYPYVRRDLLDRPERYQYSAFVGRRFLHSYSRSRQDSIDIVRDRMKRVAPAAPLAGGFRAALRFLKSDSSAWRDDEMPTAATPGVGDCDLEDVLFGWLIRTADGTLDDAVERQVSRLVHRFEVSKRLYRRYSFPDVRAVSREYDRMTSYCWFALLLQQLACNGGSRQRQAILANTALKVGDVVASGAGRMSTPRELVLAHTALSGELDLVRMLQDRWT